MQYDIHNKDIPNIICYLNKGESIFCNDNTLNVIDSITEIKSTNKFSHFFPPLFNKKNVFKKYVAKHDISKILLNASFPGNILPIEITLGNEIIVQQSSFVAAYGDINFFQIAPTFVPTNKEFSMVKINGKGIIFLAINGTSTKYNLLPEQQIVINTEQLTMIDSSCRINTKIINKLKYIFLGKKDFLDIIVTGPGKIVLQSIPNNVANHLYLPLFNKKD